MKRIGILSCLHFFIDMLCAFGVFSVFTNRMEAAAVYILYNFCAFALQMPIGAGLDYLSLLDCGYLERRGRLALIFTSIGVVLTIAGAFTFVWLLGLGNAFFHVGGGVLAIGEDNEKEMKGRGLGVFVAPGAIGLFLGSNIRTLEASLGGWINWASPLGIMAFLLFFNIILYKNQRRIVTKIEKPEEEVIKEGTIKEEATKEESIKEKTIKSAGKNHKQNAGIINPSETSLSPNRSLFPIALTILCCFICVVLRSYVGIAATFPWKTGFGISLLAVCCVAGGKSLGGFLGARIGYLRAAILSLLASALCYYLSDSLLLGLAALLLFNMTMPITLYSLAKRMPKMPGLGFGILTFGLFIGFAIWYGMLITTPPAWILGGAGSLVSLLVLIPVLIEDSKLEDARTVAGCLEGKGDIK